MYYVYMVKNTKNNLYIGISENIERRLQEHNSKRGAYFTRETNFRIVFQEGYPS